MAANSTSANFRRSYGQFGTGALLAYGILMGASALASSPEPIPWTAAASFGGTGADGGGAIQVDRAGNRYVTGSFSASARFPTRALGDPRISSSGGSSSSVTLTSAGNTDAFLAKYDDAGNLQWIVRAGGGGEDHGPRRTRGRRTALHAEWRSTWMRTSM
jgi:hypothetical protein